MKVLSGIDLVEIKRFEKILEDDNNALIKRCFTDGEISYCNNLSDKRKAESYAARYAAKEAAAKALGTGICTMGIGFLDFEIIKEQNKAPELIMTGRAKEEADKRNIISVSISLTHDGAYAASVCTMLSED